MSEISLKSDFDLAVYKEKEYRSSTCLDQIKLFDKEDTEKNNCLYTVTESDLEDKYNILIRAILDGVNYFVFEVKNDIVMYERGYGENKEYINKHIEEFEMVYIRKFHHINKYEEKKIVYINEDKIEKDAIDRIIWPVEMASGNIMIDISSDILSWKQLEDVLKELYGTRLVEKGSVSSLIAIDEFLAFISIDDIDFDLHQDFCWDLVCISPKDSRGNKYIKEIAEYLNKIMMKK